MSVKITHLREINTAAKALRTAVDTIPVVPCTCEGEANPADCLSYQFEQAKQEATAALARLNNMALRLKREYWIARSNEPNRPLRAGNTGRKP